MKLYVMRHGETPWNAEVRLQGCADVPLNENGVRLARETGQALSHVEFDAAIVSPLKRAKTTAELVLGDREIPFIEDSRIQEISFGEWEGRRCSKDHMEIPSEMIHRFFHDTPHYEAPPGGETIPQLLKRTHSFYEDLIRSERWRNATLLIATHGAAVRALMQSIFQDGDFWRNGVPPNCAVNVVEIANGQVMSVEEDRIYYEN
ncbi:MAG: histidine phosphatase family protein [Lachnospiraceae bacterium]|nr:histidine phosphatase family protein [Lachnospiraceae bacterium]